MLKPKDLNSKCTGTCCGGHVHEAPQDPGVQALNNITLKITGLDCADCAFKFESAVLKLKGVTDAKLNFASSKLKVSFDSTQINLKDIQKLAVDFGYAAETYSIANKTVFRINGMDCGDCAAKLEKNISALEGVQSAFVNFASGKMTVAHTISDSEIISAVNKAGYQAIKDSKVAGVSTTWWQKPRMVATIISGLFLIIASIFDYGLDNQIVAIALYCFGIVIGGFHVAKSGFYSLKNMVMDTNFLMFIAVAGAVAIGEWSEAATVVFLFALGNALQAYTIDKTRDSIKALMELAPPEALVRRDNTEVVLPVEQVKIDDVIIVKPGERIAMDGVVLSGFTTVNQSAITGESMPVEKHIGDVVYAGTVNENGALEITVTKKSEDSTLSKIMHMVEEAQSEKAPMQHFVDVFSKYYTPAVIVVAVLLATVPPIFTGADFSTWFYRSLVLLVISCPCALVISTPVSIVSAIGNSSRNGVLIKGGVFMEQLGQVRAFAFDKTGTLTSGKPNVTDVIALNDGYNSDSLLLLTASLEKWSEHPVAKAVINHASDLSLLPSSDFSAIPGKGARALINGEMIYAGNIKLFDDLGFARSLHESTIAFLEKQGKTVMLVGSDKDIFGVIAVADTLRHNSAQAVQALKDAGAEHVVMLTGDNRRVAESISASINLDGFYSDLLPADKAKAVKDLEQKYGKTAMIGDGVNDAPALAAANIGIAMGVAGSDAALETADVALMSDDLEKLPYVLKLSRKTLAIIKQNITFSIAIKLIFIVGTFFGFVNLWLAVIADTGASILVTLNGMRLLKKID
jgi:Cd2+/Zn2+-exporting ATPase